MRTKQSWTTTSKRNCCRRTWQAKGENDEAEHRLPASSDDFAFIFFRPDVAVSILVPSRYPVLSLPHPTLLPYGEQTENENVGEGESTYNEDGTLRTSLPRYSYLFLFQRFSPRCAPSAFLLDPLRD
ncbi:hypothetical protein R1flu_022093 [Riccia fluitans]|uniref:Uncharacterized protein n=1 Tax=Riccia fluitans TaxID=41844 RepID=A0ABD1ZRJ9_9MARC